MRNFRGCMVILVITLLYLPHYSFNALTHTTSSSARGIFINKVMLGFIDFSHLLKKQAVTRGLRPQLEVIEVKPR